MISPEVIARFEQLVAMSTVARATADGLRPAVEHWRLECQKQSTNFESAARGYGRVEVRDGSPVRLITREKRSGNLVSWVDEAVPIPELAGLADDLVRVREKLTTARSRLDEANIRASGLRGAVDSAREALRELGWKESR